MRPNPYEPPREQPVEAPENFAPVTRTGELRELLKLGKATKLRRICLGCGGKEGVRYSEKLFFHACSRLRPRGSVWLFGALFVMTRVRKTARLRLPRCSTCKEIADRAEMLQGPLIVGSIVFGFAAATAAGNGAPWIGLALLVVGSVAAGTSYRTWGRIPIYAVHIDDTGITLKGIHPAALDRLTA
jgi:hypothetical protein